MEGIWWRVAGNGWQEAGDILVTELGAREKYRWAMSKEMQKKTRPIAKMGRVNRILEL
jgi:hypothetical protein